MSKIWNVSGITKNAAEKSEVYFNLGKCIGSLEQEQSKHNQLAAKEYIKSFKNLFEYIYEEKKDFHDEATEFLAYFAALSYGIDSLEDRKKWSWTQVRRQAQGLWGSMEETRDTFVEVNIPLIALSVQQINSFFNLKNKFSFNGEASFNDFSNKEKDQISQNLSKRKVEKPNKKHDEYDGEYKDGKYHGEGRLNYSNGDEYLGGWKDGKYHGRGRLNYSNGDEYLGGWKDGKYHGEGRLNYSNGDEYDGEYKDGKYHGEGRLNYSNGGCCFGEFKAGKKHGFITIYLNNGDEFVGTFKQDKKHGRSYSIKNLDLFEGDWKDGKVLNLKRIKSDYYCQIYHDKTGIHYKRKAHTGEIIGIITACILVLIIFSALTV